jgi:hypothetical protein
MINNIIARVNGNLNPSTCETLSGLVGSMPVGGTILDLNCGEGRSTVVMGLALEQAAKEGTIVAIDSHVTDPFSDTPFQDGTVMRFLLNLRKFGVMQRVVSVVAPVYNLSFVNKRSANLVVIQSPLTSRSAWNEDALDQSMKIAKFALRKGGNIAICCPAEVHKTAFQAFAKRHFSNLEPCIASETLLVYTIG